MRNVARTFSPLLLASLLAGCGDTATYSDASASERPPVKVGQNVTVEFRRDALGAAHDLPISPRISSINGADLIVSGTVTEVRPGWIQLKTINTNQTVNGKPVESLCWIPMTVVLAIDVNS
jgi:hypothetical protein